MFSWGSSERTKTKSIIKPKLQPSPVSVADLGFKLGLDTFWLESLNVLFFGDDGSFIHNGFLVASMPLNRHKVVLNTKYFTPGTGKEHQYQSVYSVGDLRWSEDKTGCVMPGGSSFAYTDATCEFHFRFCFELRLNF